MIGSEISHYRILAKLGAGGMGVVYKAQDTRLRRPVALKFLAPHLLEAEEHRARFLREARVIASLDHPNIATIHEIDEADGRWFLSMAFVDGQPLSRRIKAGNLELDEALDFAVQIARGLQAAHRKGIVHRDIKSANLMVTPGNQIKILDFGLAQARERSDLTKTGTTMGTAAYMSPEQAQGLPTDHRTDIWSLGVVLYQMTTGCLPFSGQLEAAVAYAVVNSAHEPPSACGESLPLELDQVVAKALAKRPEDRYHTIDDLLDDLQALRSGATERIQARVVHPLRKSAAWALPGIAAATGLLFASTFSMRPVREALFGGATAAAVESIAVLPLRNLSGDPGQEYFADGITEGLITDLGQIGALRVISRRSVMQFKDGDAPLADIAEALDVDAVVEGSAVLSGDRVRVTAQLIHVTTDTQMWANTYDRALGDVLGLQADVAKAIAHQVEVTLSPEEDARLSEAREVNPEVYRAYLRGMDHLFKGTPEDRAKGLEYLHGAVAIDPADPLAYAGLAEGYVTIGHGPEPPPDVFPRARAAAERALKLDPDMPEALAAMADVALYYEWDWARAAELFERVNELNPSLAMNHYHYAWYLALFDRLDEAIEEHKVARDLDPLRPTHTAWLGGLYNTAGRHDDAIEEAQKAIELDAGYVPSYFVLARAYSRKGMHDEAIAAARSVADSDSKYGGQELLAAAYAQAGMRDEALAILAALETPSFWTGAQAYVALGDHDRALQLFEGAYQARAPILPWIRQHGGHFDALRDEPRFRDLLQRMSLPS